MKGEIDKDFYCLAERNSPKITYDLFEKCRAGNEVCSLRHRKWPTPDQYLKEYGKKWTGAIYANCIQPDCDIDFGDCPFFRNWWLCDMEEGSLGHCENNIISICACTPWGKPPYDWRP